MSAHIWLPIHVQLMFLICLSDSTPSSHVPPQVSCSVWAFTPWKGHFCLEFLPCYLIALLPPLFDSSKELWFTQPCVAFRMEKAFFPVYACKAEAEISFLLTINKDAKVKIGQCFRLFLNFLLIASNQNSPKKEHLFASCAGLLGRP